MYQVSSILQIVIPYKNFNKKNVFGGLGRLLNNNKN
jgi:hypothetical protein